MVSKMILLRHCIKTYIKVLIACWTTFGFSKAFVLWLMVVPLYYAFTYITLLLDNLFFPGYRQVEIKNPIFIVAYARSGTTFLHRLLTQTDEYTTFETWEIFFPSLTARKIVAPFITYLKQRKHDTLSPPSSGHEIKLSSKEEEEFLFMHWFDTPLLALVSPLAFSDEGYPELCFNDNQLHQESSVRLFQGCLKRQVYYSKQPQVIAKPKNSVMRIKTLLKVFPDAKIIYINRSPVETISSSLSLHRRIFDKNWSLEKIPPQKLQRHYQRSYEYCLEFHKYIQTILDSGDLSPENILEIRYQDLVANLESVLQKVETFTHLQPSPQLREIWSQAYKQSNAYTPPHTNEPLETFGFSEAQVTATFSYLLKNHGDNPEL